jgi:hypothetical protein
MAKPPAAKRQGRSEDEILDQAVEQLLRAAKDEARKKGRPIDRAQLRREGFSERFIVKVEKAY